MTCTPPTSQFTLHRCASGEFNEKFGKYTIDYIENIDGFKFLLKEGGYVMIRPSGTEPVLRVYAESATMDLVDEILNEASRGIQVGQLSMNHGFGLFLHPTYAHHISSMVAKKHLLARHLYFGRRGPNVFRSKPPIEIRHGFVDYPLVSHSLWSNHVRIKRYVVRSKRTESFSFF